MKERRKLLLPALARRDRWRIALIVYTIALVDPGARDANPRLLKALAQESGGESFRPDAPREIADVLQQIAVTYTHIGMTDEAVNAIVHVFGG